VSRRKVLLFVVLAAALVRLVYFAAHLGSPLIDQPVLDGAYFDAAARAIARGEAAPGLFTGFRPLLYPRLLAVVYRVAGDWDLYAALALQHALGVATAAMVAALAWRLWRRADAALGAGLLYALAGPPLFFEGELLVETLFTAVVAAQLLALAGAEDCRAGGDRRGALLCALLAGVLAAVGVRLRPNHLLVLVALPLLLLPKSARVSRRPLVVAALVAALTTSALLALVERPLLGRFQLVPGAGGVNLYLGNKRGADGMIPKQDWSVTYADPYRDSIEVFAEEAFRRERGLAEDTAVEPGELSRYWLGRSARELGADPWGRLALLGKKVVLFLWHAEIPNNRSFSFAAKEEVRLLAFLPVRFGLLLTLAAAGVAVAGSLAAKSAGGRSLALDATLLFVVAHAAGVVLFFVNDRYRLPVWPALAALAGGAVAALLDGSRARDARALARPALAAAAAAALSLPNWTGAALPGFGRDHLFRSHALYAQGRLTEARADADRATRLEPLEVSPWLQLGHVCAELGDVACAEASYRTALARHPDHTAALFGLGALAEKAGDVAAAHRLYCAALAAEPRFPPALAAIARLWPCGAAAPRH
jgi:tetratricopeptide (TPR) repeat protein